MNKILRHRWGFGLSAAAGVTAMILFVLLPAPRAQATAAQVLARGARAVAKLTSIHLRGQLRTEPADNFGYIDANSDFCAIELWKQLAPEMKWRVEKPGRFVIMDGQSTVLYLKRANIADKIASPTPGGAFDTRWLDRIANLSTTITNELKNALAKGWKLDLKEERGADGRTKAVVTVEARGGLPEGDYLKNKFFDNADTRRVYRFDTQTELLEGVQVYLANAGGNVLIFELSEIEYNEAIDPTVFEIQLPENVNWVQELQKLPDNEKYAAMTAEEAARTFFEACAKEDWSEAQKFEQTRIDDRVKQYLGGLELISLGKAFTSEGADPSARFVPYEFRLRPQEIEVRVSNANVAKRCVITGIFDSNLKPLDEIKWSAEPEILPEDDVYAKMSPAEVVTAYFASMSKPDWNQMRKLAPESDVEKTKRQFEEAQKRGIDIRNLLPVVEAGEATWSAEQEAYLVKCSYRSSKKWNVCFKKDAKTGRWFVSGGI